MVLSVLEGFAREERTGLAWNRGLAGWARWWDVVPGEPGVAQIRG